jgi:chromosome segregation ATPase
MKTKVGDTIYAAALEDHTDPPPRNEAGESSQFPITVSSGSSSSSESESESNMTPRLRQRQSPKNKASEGFGALPLSPRSGRSVAINQEASQAKKRTRSPSTDDTSSKKRNKPVVTRRGGYRLRNTQPRQDINNTSAAKQHVADLEAKLEDAKNDLELEVQKRKEDLEMMCEEIETLKQDADYAKLSRLLGLVLARARETKLSSQVDMLEADLKETKDHLDSEIRQRKEAETSINSLLLECGLCAQNLEECQREQAQSKEDSSALQKKLDAIKAEHIAAKRQQEEDTRVAADKISAITATIALFQEDNERIKKRNEQLDSDLVQMSQEHDGQIKGLQDQLHAEREKTKTVESARSHEKILALQLEVDTLSARLRESCKTQAGMKDEISTLNDTWKKTKETLTKTELSLEKSLASQHKANDTVLQQSRDLESAKKEKDNLAGVMSALEARLIEASTHLKQKSEDETRRSALLERQSKDLAAVKGKLESEKEQRKLTMEQNLTLQQDIASVQQKFAISNQELSRLKAQGGGTDQEAARLRPQLEKQGKLLADVKKTLKAETEKHKLTIQEKLTLGIQLKLEQQKVANLNEELVRRDSEHVSVNELLEQRDTQLASMNEQLSQVTNASEEITADLISQLERRSDELNQIQQELETQKVNHEEAVNQMTLRASSDETMLKEVNQKLSDALVQVDDMKEEINTLKTSLEQSQAKATEELESANEACKSVATELDQARGNLSAAQQRIASLEATLATQKNHNVTSTTVDCQTAQLAISERVPTPATDATDVEMSARTSPLLDHLSSHETTDELELEKQKSRSRSREISKLKMELQRIHLLLDRAIASRNDNTSLPTSPKDKIELLLSKTTQPNGDRALETRNSEGLEKRLDTLKNTIEERDELIKSLEDDSHELTDGVRRYADWRRSFQATSRDIVSRICSPNPDRQLGKAVPMQNIH